MTNEQQLILIFVAIAESIENLKNQHLKNYMINSDVIGSKIMLVLIMDQMLTEYEFSARSPEKKLLVEDYWEQFPNGGFTDEEPENLDRYQKRWQYEFSAEEHDEDLIKLNNTWQGKKDLEECFVGDSWIFANTDTTGLIEKSFCDDFNSINMKLSKKNLMQKQYQENHRARRDGKDPETVSPFINDEDFDFQIQKNIDRIYPEAMYEIAPGHALQNKFTDYEFDCPDHRIDPKTGIAVTTNPDAERQMTMERIISEDCGVMNRYGQQIRQVQPVASGYQVTPSQYNLESIASFCQTSMTDAKKIKEAYQLLHLDFNSVKEINSQIRNRPGGRNPMDATITDWQCPHQYAKRCENFPTKDARRKYHGATKQSMWFQWNKAFPEGTPEEFDAKYPDNRVTLNSLIKDIVLPELVDNMYAQGIERHSIMDVNMCERFLGMGVSRNWNLNVSNTSDVDDLSMDELMDGFEDGTIYGSDLINNSEFIDELESYDHSALLAYELSQIEEGGERGFIKSAEQKQFTYWHLGMIPKSNRLQTSGKYGKEIPMECIKYLDDMIQRLIDCNTESDMSILKRDIGRGMNPTHWFQIFLPKWEGKLEILKTYGPNPVKEKKETKQSAA